MAFIVVVFVMINFLALDPTAADNISCTSPEQCRHSHIHCASNESCFVSCTGRDACRNTTIHCPTTGDCTVHCRGSDSCWDSVIDASSSTGNFNLLCQSIDGTRFDDQCRNIHVYGSTIETNTNDLNVTCNGDLRSCVSSSIHCAVSGRCNVICNGSSSCRWMSVYGPNDNDLAVHCSEHRSCFDATIDGRCASLMDISGCKAYESCLDLTLYCPVHVGDEKRCFIEGNNNLGQDKYIGGTRIYAVHGFDDVQINYSGNYYENSTSNYHHGGQVFCGLDYDVSCAIATDGWRCRNDADYCNHAQSNTHMPSIVPTLSPTHFPITLPSFYPSESPTKPITIQPTSRPSQLLSFLPTIVSIPSTTNSVVQETANHSKSHTNTDTSLSLYTSEDDTFNSKTPSDNTWMTTNERVQSVLSSTSMNTTSLILIIALSALGVMNIICICYCKITRNKMKSELVAMQKSQELASMQPLDDYSPGTSMDADVELSLDIDMPRLPRTLEGHRSRNIISPKSELLYGYLSPGVQTHSYIDDDSGEDSHSSLYDGSRIEESETTTRGANGANSVTSLIIPSVCVRATS